MMQQTEQVPNKLTEQVNDAERKLTDKGLALLHTLKE